MSRVLVVGVLLFLALASSVLVWEGLAVGVGQRRAFARADLRRVRLRFAVAVIVLAILLWLASGMLTRAW